MGADITIPSIHNRGYEEYSPLFDAAVTRRNALEWGTPEYDAAQQEVTAYYDKMFDDTNGYLRDSYNDSSLFLVLDLSWWRDIIPLLDGQNRLPLDKVAWLKREIEQRSEVMEYKIARRAAPFDGADSAECITYFRDKLQKFLAFFSRCLDLQEPPHCSL